ncbi:hypothetical protein VPHD479_0303 [Vibrio phage D479]
MKKIRYVVSDFVLGLGGGIYTFIQDHIRLMNSLGCDTKLIILGKEDSEHRKHWNFDCEYVMTGLSYKRYDANKLVVAHLPKDAIIYCHSFEALRGCVEAGRECYNQHHYGDIIVPQEFVRYMDIHHLYSLDQWRQMMGLSHLVTNIAQSEGIKFWGDNICGGKHIVAYEPFELVMPTAEEIEAAEESDVIIISGFYKRKQIPEMLEALRYSGLKVVVFSTERVIPPRGLNCKSYITRPRSEVIAHIMKSKCLFHMSYIEIMPYALLEATPYIPAVVSDVPYTRDFITPIIKADINDLNLEQIVKDAIASEHTPFDIEKYKVESKQHWKDLWNL